MLFLCYFYVPVIKSMNVCNSDMLYEDYKKDTYSDQGNKLRWKPTTTHDYTLVNSNNCMEYKYYGNQLSVVHPGLLANIYLKPSKYMLEIEARTLPVNSIYNDAFLYRRLTTKQDVNYNIHNFKQKSKYKISPNVFSKIKMEFDIPYCHHGTDTDEEHKGWAVLQCGVIFNDPKNMLKHGHIEILNICVMDIGIYRQPEPAPAMASAPQNAGRDTQVASLEERVAELEARLLDMESRMTETNERVEALAAPPDNKLTRTGGLDDMWDVLYDTDSNMYYMNHTTGESSWVLPEGARLRNKKVVPPLPARAISPITIQNGTIDGESVDEIPDLFEKNTFVSNPLQPDLLSGSHSYTKRSAVVVAPREIPYEEQMKLAMIESLNASTG